MKNLSVVDCVAIAVSWVGVASIAFLVKDTFVAIICIAAAYYLAKWIILEKKIDLSVGDILAIAMGWGGGVAITYLCHQRRVRCNHLHRCGVLLGEVDHPQGRSRGLLNKRVGKSKGATQGAFNFFQDI
ncbi:MAG: hypothetical protein Q7S52_05640 [bacterium]|nr:hypothetical protein [bacterium]